VIDMANTNPQSEPKTSETARQSARNFPSGFSGDPVFGEGNVEVRELIEPVFNVLSQMPASTRSSFWTPV
jgi:hypothetical protein